jgi:hypothetical protein
MHGGLKNHFFEKKICLQWVQKAPKNTFWGISPVSSITREEMLLGWHLETCKKTQ